MGTCTADMCQQEGRDACSHPTPQRQQDFKFHNFPAQHLQLGPYLNTCTHTAVATLKAVVLPGAPMSGNILGPLPGPCAQQSQKMEGIFSLLQCIVEVSSPALRS